MSSIANEVSARLAGPGAEKWNSQELAMLLWAYAALGLEAEPAMVRAAARGLAERAAEAEPQQLSITAWSLACMRHYEGATMDRLAAEACQRMGSFSPQNVSNMVWAYGCLMHVHEELLAAAEARSLDILQEHSIQGISNLLWAYATLGAMPQRLATAFAGELKRRLPTEQAALQTLTNSVWSLCVAQYCNAELWCVIMAALVEHVAQHSDLADEDLSQIFQAYELLRLDLPAEAPALVAAAPPGLLDAARARWAHVAREGRVSELQRDVARVLRALGVPHEVEALTPDGLFSVDVALVGERIALEVDGPHHFTANTRALGGATAARHRLLNAAGWAVISVPYFLWDALDDAVRGAWLMQEITHARQFQAEAAAMPPGAPRPVVASADLVASLRPESLAASAARAAAAAGLPFMPRPPLLGWRPPQDRIGPDLRAAG